MQRFWETVIEPVLEAVQPKTIVEIGSDQGGNTENLLEFCRKTGSTLHVIDPDPGYDVSEWQREYGEPPPAKRKKLTLDAGQRHALDEGALGQEENDDWRQ